MRKIRYIVYKYADVFMVLLAIACTYALYKADEVFLLNEARIIMKTITGSNESLLSVGVTLASFLFAAQGILMALNMNSKIMVELRKNGYLDDFHRFCRRTEIVFIALIFPLLFMGQNIWLDKISIALYLYGLGFMLWILILFASIVQVYSNSTEM